MSEGAMLRRHSPDTRGIASNGSEAAHLAGLKTLNAVKRELAENVLRSFGSVRLRLRGFSMFPALWPGDLLLIRRQPIGEVSPGDIVLYVRDGRFVTHRVMLRSNHPDSVALVTRGDAAPVEDPAVTASEYRGKVSAIFRCGKWIDASTRPSVGTQTAVALASCCRRVAAALVRLRAMRGGAARGKEREALCPRQP